MADIYVVVRTTTGNTYRSDPQSTTLIMDEAVVNGYDVLAALEAVEEMESLIKKVGRLDYFSTICDGNTVAFNPRHIESVTLHGAAEVRAELEAIRNGGEA